MMFLKSSLLRQRGTTMVDTLAVIFHCGVQGDPIGMVDISVDNEPTIVFTAVHVAARILGLNVSGPTLVGIQAGGDVLLALGARWKANEEAVHSARNGGIRGQGRQVDPSANVALAVIGGGGRHHRCEGQHVARMNNSREVAAVVNNKQGLNQSGYGEGLMGPYHLAILEGQRVTRGLIHSDAVITSEYPHPAMPVRRTNGQRHGPIASVTDGRKAAAARSS